MTGRCYWCGRFVKITHPDSDCCDRHIPEHNARMAESIARHNQRIAERRSVPPQEEQA